MCTFNSVNEIFKALLDGKKLVSRGGYIRTYVYLKDGVVVQGTSGDKVNIHFNNPKEWSIYQEPKPWYESIPSQGVLCWVQDDLDDYKKARVVEKYYYNSKVFLSGGCPWKIATPITKEEILKFILGETKHD